MRRRVGCALALALLACGGDDPTDPGQRVLTVGAYEYTLESVPGTFATYRDRGLLTIRYADADSVAGTMASYGASAGSRAPWTKELQSIGWNADAFLVIVDADYGQYNLRLARGAGDDLTCTGRHLMFGGGTYRSYVANCTATFVAR